MEDLIQDCYLREPHDDRVAQRKYDLIGPNDLIILPKIWAEVVQPDWTITMRMWSVEIPESGPFLTQPSIQDRERDREQERDRTRERERQWERERDEYRARERERERQWELERERERDQSRALEREREREWERERERERNHTTEHPHERQWEYEGDVGKREHDLACKKCHHWKKCCKARPYVQWLAGR